VAGRYAMEKIGLRYTFGVRGVHNEKLIADNPTF
jgi:hypothetical protein